MTPTQRLAAMRGGLKFASAARRREIERKIAEIEAMIEASAVRTAPDVPAGESWAFKEHRSQAEISCAARCALAGCDQPVRASSSHGRPPRYCSVKHMEAARRNRAREVRLAVRTGKLNGIDAHQERRQEPQRHFRLIDDPRGQYRPPLPAPLRRYGNGMPAPFQDDRRAIEDHGSAATLGVDRSDIGWSQASVLA